MKRSVIGLVMCLLAVGAACKPKPCDPVPPSESAKRLGIVLDGGRLCKDGGGVGTIEYPANQKGAAILDGYKSKFSSWKADPIDDHTLLLNNGEADGLFVLAWDSTKERDVPTAVVTYCVDAQGCARMNRIVGKMKEYGAKK